MNFNYLVYFQTVYAYRNISKAALELHVSQPAVSYAISELENELGVRLFQRERRGLSPTEEGDVFYAQVCRILAQCENAKQAVRAVANQRNRLRIGVAPMSGMTVFPAIYERLKTQCPWIELEVYEDSSYNLVKKLEAENLDAVIIPEGITYDGRKKGIYCSRMVFAISRMHPLAKKKDIFIEDLADVPLAIYPNGFIHNTIIRELFARHFIEMKVAAEVASATMIKMLIELGSVGGFILKELIQDDENIRIIEFPELGELFINVVWRKNMYQSKSMNRFLECCELF